MARLLLFFYSFINFHACQPRFPEPEGSGNTKVEPNHRDHRQSALVCGLQRSSFRDPEHLFWKNPVHRKQLQFESQQRNAKETEEVDFRR